MRPKLAAALEALQAGVAEVVLADGRTPHALTAALLGAGPATRISAGGRT
jgi:acetylglutamate kinase